MPKDDRLYLGQMSDLVEKALAKIAGKTRAEYDGNEDLRLALTHLIQNMGEAARKVSPKTQAEHPEIPWKSITGMRHRVVHDYMSINFDIIWDVLHDDLPGLIVQLKKLL